MPGSPPTADGPATEPEFEASLVRLLRTAYDNGVGIEGGWCDRNPRPDRPDWDVEIYEVTKPAGL